MSTEADYQRELEAAGVTNLDSPKALIAAGWLPPDEAERLKEERDQAIAHDRQPYPTAEAYERACAALRHHRAEAEALRVVLGTIREGDDYDPGAMVMLYDQAVDEALHLSAANERMGEWLAAVQPVIDAARAFVVAARNPEHHEFWRQPWAEMTAVLVAIDALDERQEQ